MPVAAERAFLLFELDVPPGEDGATDLFALDLDQTYQVVEMPEVVGVPTAPELVAGIVNHHGRILTIVDPAPLLDLDHQRGGGGQVIILRRAGRSSGLLGLHIARSRGIVSEQAIEVVETRSGPYMDWVGQLSERLVHVLDLKALLTGLTDSFDAKRHPSMIESQGAAR